ncbi:MAG TPA: fatty acid desaturase [Verrucomicrobiae bacterium]|nr:fatty acid desaturase [Verrucomicrobiae bacterium]
MEEVASYAHAPITRDRVRGLRRLSDARGLAHMSGHLAALFAAGLLVAFAPGPLWRLPAQALEGAILIFLFAPLHETIHRTAFKNRRLNDWVAAVLGFLIVLPADYFRFFHFAHHRYTQNPERDPELASPKPRTKAAWLWAVTGIPLWRAHIVGVLQHAAGRTPEPYIAGAAARQVVREARIHLLLYAAIAVISVLLRSDAAIEFWVLPAVLGQPWLRLYLMAEHTGCPLIPDMLANSRTTLTNPLVRFFAWNMPFHAEHHSFPAVPFHALPALHADLAPALKTTARGYFAAQREILRALD